jgi:hypothetical protein
MPTKSSTGFGAGDKRRPFALRRGFLLFVVVCDTALVGALLHQTDVNLNHGTAEYPVLVPFGFVFLVVVFLALLLDRLGKWWESR